MSLDNTSHPDELVPSRYALRVGEIDVLVVSDGLLSLPGAMLAHNADPAVRAAWLNDMFLPPDVLEEVTGARDGSSWRNSAGSERAKRDEIGWSDRSCANGGFPRSRLQPIGF